MSSFQYDNDCDMVGKCEKINGTYNICYKGASNISNQRCSPDKKQQITLQYEALKTAGNIHSHTENINGQIEKLTNDLSAEREHREKADEENKTYSRNLDAENRKDAKRSIRWTKIIGFVGWTIAIAALVVAILK